MRKAGTLMIVDKSLVDPYKGGVLATSTTRREVGLTESGYVDVRKDETSKSGMNLSLNCLSERDWWNLFCRGMWGRY